MAAPCLAHSSRVAGRAGATKKRRVHKPPTAEELREIAADYEAERRETDPLGSQYGKDLDEARYHAQYIDPGELDGTENAAEWLAGEWSAGWDLDPRDVWIDLRAREMAIQAAAARR